MLYLLGLLGLWGLLCLLGLLGLPDQLLGRAWAGLALQRQLRQVVLHPSMRAFPYGTQPSTHSHHGSQPCTHSHRTPDMRSAQSPTTLHKQPQTTTRHQTPLTCLAAAAGTTQCPRGHPAPPAAPQTCHVAHGPADLPHHPRLGDQPQPRCRTVPGSTPRTWVALGTSDTWSCARKPHLSMPNARSRAPRCSQQQPVPRGAAGSCPSRSPWQQAASPATAGKPRISVPRTRELRHSVHWAGSCAFRCSRQPVGRLGR
jgi:hypothetical protein